MEKCIACNGTGKEGGWSEITPCFTCDGTGKREGLDLREEPM